MMSPAKSKTKAAGKQLVKATGKQLAKPLNVKATGARIAKHLAAADNLGKVYKKTLEAYDAEIRSASVILSDVKVNHPGQLKDVCKHIGLSRSRTAELLAIAEGRKTLEQTRADTAERQRRFKAGKKAKALPPPKSVTEKPVTDETTGNDHDPEETAKAMRAAHAEPTEAGATEEAQAETPPTEAAEETADEATEAEAEPVAKAARSRSAKARSPLDVSKKALAEFRIAVDTWLPKLSSDDRQAALNYVTNSVLLMGVKTEVAA
jgi:hypothetical protein